MDNYLSAQSTAASRLFAFTLAEVLITLGIIGIVAALTIPNLVGFYRWKTLETAFKKGASEIAQALDRYQADNGERFIPDYKSEWTLKPILLKYFSLYSDCGMGADRTEEALERACLKNYYYAGDSANNSTIYKNYTNTQAIPMTYFDDGQFVTSDGILVLLNNTKSSFTAISIDVNGHLKSPNRLGYDLFMFQIDDKDGRLRAMGAPGTVYYSKIDSYCSKASTNSMNGAGCTYKALTDPTYFKNLKF